MEPNHLIEFIRYRAEYPIRLEKSQQHREKREFAADQPKRQITLPVRAWMSATLIHAGERLQQKVTMEPTHAEQTR